MVVGLTHKPSETCLLAMFDYDLIAVAVVAVAIGMLLATIVYCVVATVTRRAPKYITSTKTTEGKSGTANISIPKNSELLCLCMCMRV